MTRRFSGDTLVVATHNHGKLEEIADLLSPFNVTVKGAKELNLPEPAEPKQPLLAMRGSKRMPQHRPRACPPCLMTAGLQLTRLMVRPVSILPIGQKRRTGATLSWR